MTASCKECGAPIVWAVTDKGKPMPVDAGYDTRGNVTLHRQREGDPPFAKVWNQASIDAATDSERDKLRFSHFATCSARNGGRNPYATDTVQQGSLLDPAIADLVNDPPAPADRRDAGMASAAEHAGEPWIDQAKAFVRKYLTEHPTMLADDLWEAGLPDTDQRKALGVVIRWAVTEGLVDEDPVDHTRAAGSNLAWRPVWRSRVFPGPVPATRAELLEEVEQLRQQLSKGTS